MSSRSALPLSVEGTWSHVILYEVPILSILSEAYFKHVDTAWSYTGQLALAQQKGERLLHEGINFSEFGTRRRRSYLAQKIVVQGLVDARNTLVGDGTIRGRLTGTSNVHFAMEFGLNPVGTIAHEWIMGEWEVRDEKGCLEVILGTPLLADNSLEVRKEPADSCCFSSSSASLTLPVHLRMICRYRCNGRIRGRERPCHEEVGTSLPRRQSEGGSDGYLLHTA